MSWRDRAGGSVLRPRQLVLLLRDAVLRNLGFKLLSILVAFGLWFFVNAGERDTEAALQVPLELHNIPANQMIVSPRVDFVDLRVSGPRTLLARIDREHMSIVFDLGGVRPGPAVFRIQTDTLNLPRGVTVVRLTPSEVTLELARVVRKSVPVRLAMAGKPPGELRVTDSKVAPEVVEIIGPADEVEKVKVAETVPFDLSKVTAGLIEQDIGLEMPREYVSLSASLVHAQLRLEEPEKRVTLAAVPVVVRNSAYRTVLKPAAVQITVRGPRSSISSLELGHGAVYIDASGREPGRSKVTPEVDLPADVELVKQEPSAVELQILKEKKK